MALVFNPPPNWPAPPAGWTPTPTWRPDPAWGPVPDGWQLWVEEPDPEPIDVDETPLEPLISEESAEALGASEPVAEVPVEAPAEPVAEPTVEVAEAEISAEIPAPVEAVPAEPVVAEQAGAESHEAEPKPMRYLTPVPLQETALPEQVLNPVAEVAPAAPTIPVAPVPADVPAEPAHEAPAESVAPAESPVVPAEQAPAEASLPHSVESSPLIEFHSSPEQPAQAPEASAPAPADVAAPQAFAGQEFAPQAPAGQEFTGREFAGQDFSNQQNPHQGAADSFGGQPDQFQGEQFAPQHGGQPYNPYQPAAQAGQQGQQAQPAAAFNPYVPQMDSAPQHEQQNPQPADSEPKKKGAFSGKLLGIIGAALALLIVIILVVVMLLPRGGSDSSDHSKQAAGTSTSASAQSSDGSSSTTAAEAKLPEGEYKEYKETVTEDKKNIDIEKVKGDASKGIVYYEFKPSDDMSSRAYITSLTDKGENSTGLSVIDMTVDRTPIRGTAWLDTTNPSSPTRKLELNGKGEWLIRVYDESSAPNYTKGEKFHTTMNYYAYTYDGGESTMEFEAKGLDSKRGFALMSASRSDLLFGTSVANMKSSMEWKSTGKNFLQVRSTSSADWSISTH
ncbi:hypothetical protein [uncultured Rothia sp.]|uniref:hypothetical protein n=1 Tax=uncultured Rothia sp. TaxID=316088 RepID=UPI0025D838F6|nr:hypothetical protein [uncultured Rothia sp.]